MNENFDSTGNNETSASAFIGAQREQVVQRLAGVQERLESKGVGAAFHRAAKADPVGELGFVGGMIFHAILSGPMAELIGEHISLYDSTLALGGAEGISAMSESADERSIRRSSLRKSFYPLGRRKPTVKQAKLSTAFNQLSANRHGRFSSDVQAELGGMFKLMDMLNKLEEQGAQETARDNTRSVQLAVSKSSPAYQGAERRRRPRHEGLFNA